MADKKGKVEFFKDKAGEYRWKLYASNGRIIADSSEGYSSYDGCKNGFESVKVHVQNPEVVEKIN
ncbi:MAG: DUF1508 domain-containing protein [Acidobacteria bacterium]|jgi:hypothetical protein|nr:DUF1508 domain-containing protein [Acidobacteriota bacterium]